MMSNLFFDLCGLEGDFCRAEIDLSVKYEKDVADCIEDAFRSLVGALSTHGNVCSLELGDRQVNLEELRLVRTDPLDTSKSPISLPAGSAEAEF
jgi:hypothetical protein